MKPPSTIQAKLPSTQPSTQPSPRSPDQSSTQSVILRIAVVSASLLLYCFCFILAALLLVWIYRHFTGQQPTTVSTQVESEGMMREKPDPSSADEDKTEIVKAEDES